MTDKCEHIISTQTSFARGKNSRVLPESGTSRLVESMGRIRSRCRRHSRARRLSSPGTPRSPAEGLSQLPAGSVREQSEHQHEYVHG